jgi:hypothetical protein
MIPPSENTFGKRYICHPERSEGSQLAENKRFFAALRMTMFVNGEFCKTLRGVRFNPASV